MTADLIPPIPSLPPLLSQLQPILDAGLGGSAGAWGAQLRTSPEKASALSGGIFDLHLYHAWQAPPLIPARWIPQVGALEGMKHALKSPRISPCVSPVHHLALPCTTSRSRSALGAQAVHLRQAACGARDTLRGYEEETGLRAMVGEWSLAVAVQQGVESR